MADKLRDDQVFSDRIINFTSALILSDAARTPITEFEKRLIGNKDKIRELNKEIPEGLVSLLRSAKEFIPPPTALRMLLYLKSKGLTAVGHQIVYYAARDEHFLSEEEITELMAEVRADPELNVEWYMTLLSSEREVKAVETKGSGLNLPTDFR